MIQIDQNFKINSDGLGCTLIQTQQKERINKDTKQSESYQTESTFHFLNVEQCLNRYLDLVMEPSEDVIEVLSAIKQARLEIKSCLALEKT